MVKEPLRKVPTTILAAPSLDAEGDFEELALDVRTTVRHADDTAPGAGLKMSHAAGGRSSGRVSPRL